MPRFPHLILLFVLLLVAASVHGQGDKHEARPQRAAAPTDQLLTVNVGEKLFLQLETPLNTSVTQVGDPVRFITTEHALADGLLAIPRGSLVSGRVSKVRRPGRLKGRAEIGLRLDQLTLPDGASFAAKVSLVRAGFTQLSLSQAEPALKGEGGGVSLVSIGLGGAQGAIVGGAYGGAVGLGIGLLSELLQRAPDLDLPRNMAVEVAFARPLQITAAAAQRATKLARDTALRSSRELSQGSAEPVPDFSQDERSVTRSSRATETTEATTASTKLSLPPLPDGDTRRSAPVFEDTGYANEFKLKVDVQLVTVDAVVRDRTGRVLDALQREDFRVFEDGIEQPITSFSRDRLPLAVALVVDRSGSVAPIMRQLRRAAFQALSQLKPEDQVCLFAFADQAHRLEDLTTDRQRIANRIATIDPGGGTDINDALFDAVHYLSSVVHDRRRAVILISDNETTTKPRSSVRKLIHLATESETVVYSIRITPEFGPSGAGIPIWLDGPRAVAKVTLETGGEIIDAPDTASLSEALATVVFRLKLRYALGYQPDHVSTTGTFRKITVRLADRFGQLDSDYSVHARRGYYPSVQSVARQSKPRS